MIELAVLYSYASYFLFALRLRRVRRRFPPITLMFRRVVAVGAGALFAAGA